jgi:hypothetical protein
MKKFFEHTITLISEFVILTLCVLWFVHTGDYEPMIGIVGSVTTIIISLLFKFKKEDEEEVWKKFRENNTTEERKQIEELRKLLDRTEKSFDFERLQLSARLNEKQTELDKKNALIDEMERQLKKVDLSQTSTLYQQAFALFVKGELDEALAVLGEAKLDEQ